MGPFPTRKVFFLVIGACLFAFLLPAPTPGQLLQGSMTGTVVDPSGAAAPDAEVSALNTQTGLSRSAFTNDVGQYSFPNLDAGALRRHRGQGGISRPPAAGGHRNH